VREALVHEPQSARLHSVLALAFCAQGMQQRAAAEAGAAVAAAPDDGYAHYVLGYVRHVAGRLDAAAEALDEALRLEPQRAGYHLQLATVRLAQQRYGPALAAADVALACDAERVDAAVARADALRGLRRYDEASETLDGALRREPANADVLAARGALLIATNRARDAHDAFREALAIDPGNDPARNGLIVALKENHPLYRAFKGGLVYVVLAAAAVPAFLHFGPDAVFGMPVAGWLPIGAYVVLIGLTVDGVVTTFALERAFGPGAVARAELTGSRGVCFALALGATAFVAWAVWSSGPALVGFAVAGMMAPQLRLAARIPAPRFRAWAQLCATCLFPLPVLLVWALVPGAGSSAVAAAAAVLLGAASTALLARRAR